jgi:CelD/BcsL family acetyltransferase involved in cellulose biosynthesis
MAANPSQSDTLKLAVSVAPPASEPENGVETRLVRSDDLPRYTEAWWKLADAAVVPNAFYEPWMLLPAIEQAKDSELYFLLVLGEAGTDGDQPLWGFFPLRLQSKCLRLPIRNLSFWHHRNCHLTAPLVDRAHTWEVLDTFWRWFEQNPWGCSILDTEYFPADGRFHEVWADYAIGRSSLILRDFPRALFSASGTAQSYITSRLSKKHYDEYLRQERRLSELGKLEYRQVESISDVEGWVDEFLQLEAVGWKGGTGGNAFAKFDQDVSYLQTISREGLRRNRVMLLSLTLNGRAIAMKHNLLAGDGGFALRIAYDESFAKYSPGVLLELENIRRVFNSRSTKWLDSCAIPRHVMADRIWRERRMIRRTLFSNGSRRGDFWIATLPLLRWLRHQVRRGPEEDYLRISTKRTHARAESRG